MKSIKSNPEKIVPRIFGGLGNQLFIYSAARRLAMVNGSELVLDDVSGFARDFKYKRSFQLDHFNISCRRASAPERLEPFSLIRRYIKRKINNNLPYELRNYIIQEGMDFDERFLHIRNNNIIYIDGYWQSEKYFKDVDDVIRKDLKIKNPSDFYNINLAKKIEESLSVSVHVRFFDTPVVSNCNNINNDYYSRAISIMEQIAPNAHYYVFSDRPDAARLRIPLSDDRITLVNHNVGDEMAYADLWLMTKCKHFIIANSTFSWWGAWLSESETKKIIAPDFEKRDGLSSWGFKGLLPDDWIKV